MVQVIILRYQITDVNCKTNASCKRSIVICFIIYHMSDVMKDFREEKKYEILSTGRAKFMKGRYGPPRT